jgi:enoyl-CoA hydratase
MREVSESVLSVQNEVRPSLDTTEIAVTGARIKMSEILTSASGALARIVLNRPQTLHALTAEMCADMLQALLGWRDDDSVRAVLLEHQPGTRGFCAGGDIRMIAESGAGDGKAARDFFFTEYRLNHLLFHYPKPVIAFLDGITMGGGVGISMPARFRVATENTTYAMPETGIGLFPDVGGGWYLPRKPGEIGMWLALTGARIKAADCIEAGIATHYMPAAKLDAARAQIAGAADSHDAGRTVASRLDALSESPGAPKELAPESVARINRIFRGESVEAILAALEKDGSNWARAQLETVAAKSPQALKVSFRQLREGARMQSFAHQMRQEFRIAVRVSKRHDFIEGVRALLVDKDNSPKWDPPTLAGVTDAMVDEIFAPLEVGEEWSPL